MDGVRTRGPRRGRGVLTRSCRTSAPLVAEEVAVTRGRHGRGGRRSRGRRLTGHKIQPLPYIINEPIIRDISNMPSSQGLEKELHPKRRRITIPEQTSSWISQPSASTSSAQDGEVVVEVDPLLLKTEFLEYGDAACSPPFSSPKQCSRPHQTFRDYGSEESSDEDDDELVSPVIPRVFRSALETPLDDSDGVPFDLHSYDPPDNTAIIGPSYYHFDWKPFPDPPIPKSRRETFSDNNVGPTAPYVDPYDIFVAIWDRQFMEHIVVETNRYAQEVAGQMLAGPRLQPNSRILNWHDTTVDELYSYFAIVIAMGVVIKRRMREYWNSSTDIFSTPSFSSYMSINRFILLNKCLHFSNNEEMRALNLSVPEARLFKIQPVLSHLNVKFSSMYNLKQNICIDESLLMCKGWSHMNQYIHHKAKVGVKSYEVCESQTGYLCRFVMDTPKSPLPKSEDPIDATTVVVLRLIHGLEYKGHTLWMDSFYNSPTLARRLKSLGFDCVGTLRTNRKFVPRTLQSLTSEDMAPGQIAGLTSGDVDVMVWRDVNRVAMISTYHGNAVAQVRESIKPTIMMDYNIMMGGVDKKDQLLATYPVERKRTRVWYKKLFKRLLNISVLNSYIIHNQCLPPLSHHSFRVSLVKSLLSKHCESISRPIVTPKVELTHRLSQHPFRASQRLRRNCKICRKLTTTFCVACDKTVCMEPCFLTLHS